MIYFAHSMRIYNTKLETKLLKFISKKFGRKNVCCPNNDMGELGRIEPYLKKILTCTKVVVHQYKNYLGKGACEEVKTALNNNIPVVLIIVTVTNRCKLKKVKAIKVIDKYDWKVKYGQIILK